MITRFKYPRPEQGERGSLKADQVTRMDRDSERERERRERRKLVHSVNCSRFLVRINFLLFTDSFAYVPPRSSTATKRSPVFRAPSAGFCVLFSHDEGSTIASNRSAMNSVCACIQYGSGSIQTPGVQKIKNGASSPREDRKFNLVLVQFVDATLAFKGTGQCDVYFEGLVKKKYIFD